MNRLRGAALLGAGALACAVPTAHALPPDQVFDRAAPAVWSVKAYGAEERLLASASGVVVAPGKLVTSCHVLAGARQVQLRRGNTIYDAKLEFPDVERDLCQLDAPGLSAPAPAPGSARGLRTGQRLYVIGFGQGNVPTLGEGLVSAVAQAGGRELIQTSVPLAASLRGAGVFDEEAKLVGIVTFSPADAPPTVFAVPAEQLAEVPARGAAALAAYAARAKPPTPAASTGAPGMPAAGTVWTYEFSDRAFRRRQGGYSVRAVRVDGTTVEESVTSGNSADARRVISAKDTRFAELALTAATSAMELAPYLLAAAAGKPPEELASPEGYPIGSPGLPSWVVKATVQGWDQVAVPAGNYKALRIDVEGRRGAAIGGRSTAAGRFTMSVWYGEEVKRIVRLEHRVWTADGISPAIAADEVIELTSYRLPTAAESSALASAPAVQPSTARAGFPATGTTWVYGFAERLFARRKADVTVRALEVSGDTVTEAVTSSAGAQAQRAIDSRATRFVGFSVVGNATLVELAPYLLSPNDGKLPEGVLEVEGYPSAATGSYRWKVRAQVEGWEQVTVPAGTFKALRVEVDGALPSPPTNYIPYRFRVVAWYSPDVRRLVRLEHKAWSGGLSRDMTPYADDLLELQSYRPPS